MEEEVLKYINEFYQKMKVEFNKSINSVIICEKNVERYEPKMLNLEYEYCQLKKEKFLIKTRYYLLSIITLGIYKLISKKHYKSTIEDIDEQIVNIVFDTSNLKKLIKENEILLNYAN